MNSAAKSAITVVADDAWVALGVEAELVAEVGEDEDKVPPWGPDPLGTTVVAIDAPDWNVARVSVD